MRVILITLLIAIIVSFTTISAKDCAGLATDLLQFVADKDATIGIAVIVEGKDTVEVNGNRRFPMLSVYKFPIALAFAEKCRIAGVSFTDSTTIAGTELLPDTYSPMRDRYAGEETIRLSYADLLKYSLQQSDNNASDIILREAGGVRSVADYLRSSGITGMDVATTEEEMHIDNSLCYHNSSTPLAMARLLDRFASESGDQHSSGIKEIMETCATGKDRLVAPFATLPVRTGHKTGTGFELPGGRLMAVNDAGYVLLPDGRRYSIAVFVEDSGYDMDRTSAIIAEISRIVYSHIQIW